MVSVSLWLGDEPGSIPGEHIFGFIKQCQFKLFFFSSDDNHD